MSKLSESDRKKLLDEMRKMVRETIQSSSLGKTNKSAGEVPVDLESEQFRSSRLLRKEFYKLHPWARFVPEFAPSIIGMVDDIKKLDDMSALQSIVHWTRTSNSTPTSHQRHLLMAIEKLPVLKLNADFNNKQPSLFITMVNKIDIKHSMMAASPSDESIEACLNEVRMDNCMNDVSYQQLTEQHEPCRLGSDSEESE